MSDFSDYFEQALIDHVFNKSSLSSFTEMYVALSTVTIVDADTGSTITEPSGNGYARAKTYMSDWTRVDSVIDNDNDIEFAEASGSWGTITDIALCSAVSAGNMLAFKALSQSKAIDNGDTARFKAGDLDFSIA